MNEKVKKQIIALLQAAQSGDTQATQALQAIMTKAKQGDKKAIALAKAIQQVAQEMQGGGQTEQPTNPVAARLGAKLNYIRNLKGNAPEGQEVVYYKCGGQIKKKFVSKDQGGDSIQTNGKKVIANFKKKATTNKPTKLDPKTTKTLPGGKYPSNWTSHDRQVWEREHGDNDEGAGVVTNKGIGKNCNGGKAKKHQAGGSLNGSPFSLTFFRK